MDNGRLKPFLRWAGGKQLLVNRLIEFIPFDRLRSNFTYYEPFLGAGSLFFALGFKRAVLADLNAHLINAFRAVQEKPVYLSELLRKHMSQNSKAYYYRVREAYNSDNGSGTVVQAARFIYLNQTCFNGVFRVNTQGKYNVPYGDKKTVRMPDTAELKKMSKALKSAKLLSSGYERALKSAKRGDFVYLDPPYPPINGTAYFTHYTKERFGKEDQTAVRDVANELSNRGCLVMISNADLDGIRSLYSSWRIGELEAVRYVSCKKSRHRVGELIVTNF